MTNEDHGYSEDLVVVFQAPDESSAIIVAGLLESEGIPATLLSSATEWGGRYAFVDAFERKLGSYWGDVAVDQADAQRSLEIIKAYAPEEQNTTEPAVWQEGTLRMMAAMTALVLCIAAYHAWREQFNYLVFANVLGGIYGFTFSKLLSGSEKYTPTQRQQISRQIADYLLYAAVILFTELFIIFVFNIAPGKFFCFVNLIAAVMLGYKAFQKIPNEGA